MDCGDHHHSCRHPLHVPANFQNFLSLSPMISPHFISFFFDFFVSPFDQNWHGYVHVCACMCGYSCPYAYFSPPVHLSPNAISPNLLLFCVCVSKTATARQRSASLSLISSFTRAISRAKICEKKTDVHEHLASWSSLPLLNITGWSQPVVWSHQHINVRQPCSSLLISRDEFSCV